MTDVRTIKLGGREIPIHPIPLGRVRRLPVVCNRVYRAFGAGVIDDAVTDDIMLVLHLGTGLSLEDLDNTPAGFDELTEAISVITEVAGLKPKPVHGAAVLGGEQPPAMTPSAGGMTSTPT
jgi:hypothetical protein